MHTNQTARQCFLKLVNSSRERWLPHKSCFFWSLQVSLLWTVTRICRMPWSRETVSESWRSHRRWQKGQSACCKWQGVPWCHEEGQERDALVSRVPHWWKFQQRQERQSLWIARRPGGWSVESRSHSVVQVAACRNGNEGVISVERPVVKSKIWVSSKDDAHVPEPTVSPTWIDQNQTHKTDLASILPTWVDMSRGDDEVEAREPHRRRIMPGQNRADPVHMEDEVEDVVSALKRDLPVLSHTPTAMFTGRRLVLIPQTQGGTPRFVQDVSVGSSDTEVHEPPGDMLLGVGDGSPGPATSASMWQVRSVGRRWHSHWRSANHISGSKASETVGVDRWQVWTWRCWVPTTKTFRSRWC